MAGRRRELNSNGSATESEEYRAIWVDTSLDSHLAVLVSTSDTVSDFKKKILLEHRQLFPEIGCTHINSVMVKRKKKNYHLPDSMPVWRAFDGLEGICFVSVDALSTRPCQFQNHSEPDISNDTRNTVMVDVRKFNDNDRAFSPDVNTVLTIPMSSPNSGIKGVKSKKKKKKAKVSTQNNLRKSVTEKTLDDVASLEKEVEKKTQGSIGNDLVELPILEEDNPTLELNQVDRDSHDVANIEKNVQTKKRKEKLPTLIIKENLPVTDQNIVVEVLTTQENLTGIENPENKGVQSSQVVPSKSEGKPEEKHDIGVNFDDLARPTKDEGEGVNFKQYFVPGQIQGDTATPANLKKAKHSNKEMETLIEENKKSSPSVSMSMPTEVHSSLKLSATHVSEKISCAGEDDEGEGNLARNSDQNGVLPDSSGRSSRLGEDGVKNSRTLKKPGANLKKPRGILAETSLRNKKNDPFEIENPDKVPRKRGNKRSQSGLIVTNLMEMKTPKKKSLLSRRGTLFQDNSGESSGAENESTHSSGSTRSASDSSSMSDHSEEESDLSQGSTKDGRSDAQGKSNERKDTTKLDQSASQNMTMDMILRSSKRFKKAKILAAQMNDEADEIEFVPDSLPV